MNHRQVVIFHESMPTGDEILARGLEFNTVIFFIFEEPDVIINVLFAEYTLPANNICKILLPPRCEKMRREEIKAANKAGVIPRQTIPEWIQNASQNNQQDDSRISNRRMFDRITFTQTMFHEVTITKIRRLIQSARVDLHM
ncbi:hypothetical protein [Candidatus Magnetominusculus dajiuhuensis]|uniref:hypothetical protein n=1 Tax=Candidatus Magnetominusculus dajiuhuensis TaxID=3137712 RepID=UPI003B42FBA4